MSVENQERLGKQFLIQWIIATVFGHILSFCIGLSIGTLLQESHVIPLFIFISVGLFISLCQWIVLSRVVQKVSGWVWIGWLGFIVVNFILIFSSFQYSQELSRIHILLIFLSYPLCISLGHWLVLRQLVKNSARYFLVDFLAISLSASFLLVEEPYIHLSFILVSLFRVILSGFLQGTISGIGITWLLKYRQPKVLDLKYRKSEMVDEVEDYDRSFSSQKGIQFLNLLLTIIIGYSWFSISLQNGLILRYNFSFPIFFYIIGYVFLYLIYHRFSILIHELGHLFLALLCRARLNFISVSGITLFRDDQKLRFKFVRHPGAAGLTSTIPSSTNFLRQKLILKILGGPLASLLLFLVGVILLLSPNITNQNYVLQAITLSSGLNLYFAIFNSLPIRSKGYANDGFMISELIRNTRRGQQYIAVNKFLARLEQGRRPRYIESEIFEVALSIPESSCEHLDGLMMSYFRELDAKDLEKAESYLRQALKFEKDIPDLCRSELFLELAFIDAYLHKSIVSAKEWFSKATETTFIRSYRIARVTSAILLEEGDYSLAWKTAKQGFKSANGAVTEKGMARVEADWLKQILKEIKAKAKI